MEPVARSLDRRPPDLPSRLATAVAEVRPAAASAAARALQVVARGGTDALRGLASPSIVWVPRASGDDAWSFVGWGTAARADGEGADRLADVQARAERVWSRVDRAGALPIAPRLFGGFAFDAGGDARERLPDVARRETELGRAWAPFGDASFVLPRLLFGCSSDRAFVAAFPPPDQFAETMRASGLRVLEVTPLMFGASILFVATPDRGAPNGTAQV